MTMKTTSKTMRMNLKVHISRERDLGVTSMMTMMMSKIIFWQLMMMPMSKWKCEKRNTAGQISFSI